MRACLPAGLASAIRQLAEADGGGGFATPAEST